MKITDALLYVFAAIPLVAFLIFGFIILLGNNNILRAGGQTAHENYPKVIAELGKYFAFILGGTALFFLAVLGILPSDAVITLVSIIVGAFGALQLRSK